MNHAQNNHTLPKRAEVEMKDTWDLSAIFPSDQEWENALKEIKAELSSIRDYQGKLATSASTFLEALQLRDQISMKMSKVYVYAHLKKDEDSTNSTYVAFLDRAVALMSEVNHASSFITPEILDMQESVIDRFLREETGLQLYRHHLAEINRLRNHYLSPEEEAIIAQAGEMAAAPAEIFSMINEADMKFPTVTNERGEEIEITHGRFISLMESKDRRVRKETFEGFYSTYRQHRNSLAATLNATVKKNIFMAKVRKYPSALQSALGKNNIPIEVYDHLISTIEEYLPVFHRYIQLRKQILGLDELHFYDLFAPLVPEMDMHMTFEEAKQVVRNSLRPLGEEYLSIVDEGFSKRWIDVYENVGKRSGAYSFGTYGTPPYILMNYQPNIENVYTLTHEMGHSVHSYYSRKHQPYVYAGYTTFVAEVASTVNEALLTHYLLKETSDLRGKCYILNHYLNGFRATVFRQTMFAEFEKMIHERVEAGGALTADICSKLYYDLNRKYYGSAIVLDRDIELEWARIPHFYMNFYVYQYATGFSAASALSKQILEEGEPAVDRYIQFLKGGSSAYPIDLLQKAGVDMTSPQPVRRALEVFKETLDQFEQLMNQQNE